MKTKITLFRITGVCSILFLAFHFAFPAFFRWSESLACLNPTNKGILITYHYMSMSLFVFMIVLFLFQSKALLASPLRYSILPLVVLIFTIRIITQFTHFGGISSPLAPIVILFCLVPVVSGVAGLIPIKQ